MMMMRTIKDAEDFDESFDAAVDCDDDSHVILYLKNVYCEDSLKLHKILF